jgi:hypothetical protein
MVGPKATNYADKSGRTWGDGARSQDLICNVCPDKVDDALTTSQPVVHEERKSWVCRSEYDVWA